MAWDNHSPSPSLWAAKPLTPCPPKHLHFRSTLTSPTCSQGFLLPWCSWSQWDLPSTPCHTSLCQARLLITSSTNSSMEGLKNFPWPDQKGGKSRQWGCLESKTSPCCNFIQTYSYYLLPSAGFCRENSAGKGFTLLTPFCIIPVKISNKLFK